MRSKYRPSILVVDDEPMILQALEMVLAEPGRNLRMAGSLAKALACPAPDLLIADVRLGDGSGLDLAWFLRSISPDLRVILTTGDPTDLGGTPPPGALVLAKPFELDQIEETRRPAHVRSGVRCRGAPGGLRDAPFSRSRLAPA